MSINIVALMGRLTRDPDIRYGQNGDSIAKFTVAVDRRKAPDGTQTADFINCTAFRKSAELIEKWFHKGDPIGLDGHIHTDSYTNKDGQKVFTTEVICDHISFVPQRSASAEQIPTTEKPKPTVDGFMEIPEGGEEGLPFL